MDSSIYVATHAKRGGGGECSPAGLLLMANRAADIKEPVQYAEGWLRVVHDKLLLPATLLVCDVQLWLTHAPVPDDMEFECENRVEYVAGVMSSLLKASERHVWVQVVKARHEWFQQQKAAGLPLTVAAWCKTAASRAVLPNNPVADLMLSHMIDESMWAEMAETTFSLCEGERVGSPEANFIAAHFFRDPAARRPKGASRLTATWSRTRQYNDTYAWKELGEDFGDMEADCYHVNPAPFFRTPLLL